MEGEIPCSALEANPAADLILPEPDMDPGLQEFAQETQVEAPILESQAKMELAL